MEAVYVSCTVHVPAEPEREREEILVSSFVTLRSRSEGPNTSENCGVSFEKAVFEVKT